MEARKEWVLQSLLGFSNVEIKSTDFSIGLPRFKSCLVPPIAAPHPPQNRDLPLDTHIPRHLACLDTHILLSWPRCHVSLGAPKTLFVYPTEIYWVY